MGNDKVGFRLVREQFVCSDCRQIVSKTTEWCGNCGMRFIDTEKDNEVDKK